LGFSILLLEIFYEFEFLKKNQRSGKKKCLYGVRKTDSKVFIRKHPHVAPQTHIGGWGDGGDRGGYPRWGVLDVFN